MSPEIIARRHLLVVAHSATGSTRRMTDAVLAGAHDPSIEQVTVRERAALEATADDVLWAEAVVLGTPANFGYMSGALKHFFDTIYHPCLDHTRGLPYALFVKGGYDAEGAVVAVQRIVTGLAWRETQPPIVVVGELTDAHLSACHELGAMMAASLSAGLW